MNFNLKMVFLWWLVGWRAWRINKYARKYRKLPDQYTPQQRNDWLLKKAKKVLKLFNIKLNVEGYENLTKGPMLLVPNHKNNMDPIIILVALAKQTGDSSVMNKIPTFLAKKELMKKRTTRNTLSLLDTFFIDRNDFRQSIEALNNFGAFVKENRTYGVVFPEGRRVSEKLELDEFKAGAFKIASSQYLPIVPVAISDTREADNKNRNKKLNVTVKFLTPIKPSSFIGMDFQAIGNRCKEIIEKEVVVNERSQ
ncbi:lysophospholipid acyltransferase family protein [Mycoplasmopsis lipofaciens]|uniref:lysophospholipid acyltransferase family protein n=1 Tax=Mycoplasmopsis lipofaciens TaxID=114884 RepID=UPI00047F765C|nr:lysophospholipid acyltransferase family protein [Mycoplasmopsis lipofaciens]